MFLGIKLWFWKRQLKRRQEKRIQQLDHEYFCPYCNSKNEAIRQTFYDQTCAGCVERMNDIPKA